MKSLNNNNHINSIKKIRSIYIIKKLFSNLTLKKKYYLIRYSKDIQNKLEINIQDYKKVSGRYKINGINGEGKEYLLDSNILIFEGDYKNGRRNGKGKEYDEKGRLKFEGDYLNGEKKGDGNVIVCDNGKKKFEGLYKNWKKITGKDYCDGKIMFDGEYKDENRWNGKGKEYSKINNEKT